MLKIYRSDPSKCIPFIIGRNASDTSNRIGGHCPLDIRPTQVTERTRFVLTISLSRNPDLDVSTFIGFDFDEYYDNRGVGSIDDSDLVRYVVHPPSPISPEESLASELSCHSLVLCNEEFDSVTDDEIWTHHKIGGTPYFGRFQNRAREWADTMGKEGFVHLLQLAFPDSDDASVTGTWPFHDSLFHLFAHETEAGQFRFGSIWA